MGEEIGGIWTEEGDQTFDLWPMHTDFWNMADGEHLVPLWSQGCSYSSAELMSPCTSLLWPESLKTIWYDF